MSPISSQATLFEQAEQKFDLDRLRSALEEIGQIDPRDWEFLKGVLCGLDQGEIAKQCCVSKGHVRTALSGRVRLHVLNLFPDKKNVDWKRLPEWLIKAGYGTGEHYRVDWQKLCRNEEMKYLQSITEKFQVWWKRDASWMEIDESDWFKFGLKIKIPKSNREENSSYAGYEGKEHLPVPILEALDPIPNEPVLIIGKPGAGKSTFLAQFLQKAAEKALQDSTASIPVLIALKSYGEQPDITHLIRAAFEEENFLLGIPEPERMVYIENLIKDKRLLLLADGVNELPEERVRNSLKAFCCKQMPMIFTTRDTSAGNLGIQKKLEIQPLSSGEVEKFLRDRLPGRDQNRVRELCDRVRDFGQTPLMAWMLYSVFKQKDTIPATRGEAYREFTTIYSERAKEGIDLEQSRSLLCKLAFEMMRSHKLEDFRLEISEDDAKDLFGELNQEHALRHLRNHHLLQNEQRPGNCKLRFCHQSLQEYYAAEELFRMARQGEIDLTSKEFQQFYLNYQKWTEPIALMLGLIDESNFRGSGRERVEQIINLALSVDLMLSARLAGEVKEEFQEKTIELVNQCKLPNNREVPERFRVELLGRTRSKKAIPYVLPMLEAEDEDIYKEAAKWLGDLEAKAAIPKLQDKLSNLNSSIQELCTNKDVANWMSTVEALGKLSKQNAVSELHNKILQGLDHPFDFFTLFGAGTLLGKFDNESILPELFAVLKDQSSHVRRANAALVLGQIGNELAIGKLINALDDDQHPSVRKAVVNALEQFDAEEALSGLIQALIDQNHSVYNSATRALIQMENQAAIPKLHDLLHHSNGNVGWLAAVVLGHLGNDGAFSRLRQELSNSNSNTRKVAVEALGQLANQQVILELLSVLQSDLDYDVWRSAAIALGQLGNKDEDTLSELLKALRHYYPHELNENIKTSLNLNGSVVIIQGMSEEKIRTLGDEDAVQRWLWEHRNLDTRIKIAKALAKLGIEDAIRGLFDGLKRESTAYTRLAAAIALGQLGKEEATQELLDSLKDVDPNTRKEITAALVKLGNQQIVFELLKLLQDNSLDSGTRWSIAFALERIEGDETSKYLPDLIKLIPTKIQWQALWAILGIQAECKFYNYDIKQEATQRRQDDRTSTKN